MNPRASRDLRAGLVVVGFLVLLAFSPAPACLRKPPKEETVKVTLRALPQGDTLSSKYGLSEVIATPLGRVLPGVRFYQGIERIKCYGAEYPYLIAIVGGKRYSMPGGFDWLLFDKGMKVTDNNIVKLAGALLIASVCSDHRSCPDIVFLGATRTKMKAWTTDAAQLKVKIDAQTQEWHFNVLRNQFEGATRVDEKGVLKDYNVIPVESLPKR